MKKYILIFVLSLCLVFCGCEKTQEISVETSEVTATLTTKLIQETTLETTEPPTETTIPATETPRVIGPEAIDGKAATIENVSVEYSNELPRNIKSSTTYSVCGFKDEFVLNESQVYAEIHFTITNKTTSEMKIADIKDNFLVELIYDNQFVYSPDTNSWCFFKAGSQTAVVSGMASIGAVTLAPLTTKDVIVYMPCAKEVSTELDNFLIVVFTSNYSGYENYEFIIR